MCVHAFGLLFAQAARVKLDETVKQLHSAAAAEQSAARAAAQTAEAQRESMAAEHGDALSAMQQARSSCC